MMSVCIMENKLLVSQLVCAFLVLYLAAGIGGALPAFAQYTKPTNSVESRSRSKTTKQTPQSMVKPPKPVPVVTIPRPVFAKEFNQDSEHGITIFTDKEGQPVDGYFEITYSEPAHSYDLEYERYVCSVVGHLRKGLREGKWITHFLVNDKDLDYTETYQKGLLSGPFTVFNADKRIHYQTAMENGNGVWKAFYAKSKHVRMEGNYKEGREDGIWLSYYSDGRIKERLFYDKGTLLTTTPIPID